MARSSQSTIGFIQLYWIVGTWALSWRRNTCPYPEEDIIFASFSGYSFFRVASYLVVVLCGDIPPWYSSLFTHCLPFYQQSFSLFFKLAKRFLKIFAATLSSADILFSISTNGLDDGFHLATVDSRGCAHSWNCRLLSFLLSGGWLAFVTSVVRWFFFLHIHRFIWIDVVYFRGRQRHGFFWLGDFYHGRQIRFVSKSGCSFVFLVCDVVWFWELEKKYTMHTKPEIISIGRIVPDKTETHVESIPANVFSRELLRPIISGLVVYGVNCSVSWIFSFSELGWWSVQKQVTTATDSFSRYFASQTSHESIPDYDRDMNQVHKTTSNMHVD